MNKSLHFISGNKVKIKEAEMLLDFPIKANAIDLMEIQDMSIESIAKAKATEAFNAIKEPVLVDDVGFFIHAWNGFPGPLIKWLLKSGGTELLLHMLENEKNRGVDFVSAIGFHDGEKAHVFIGKVTGTICFEPRATRPATNLETIFVPDGQSLTYAEMTQEHKNTLSHRRKSLSTFKDFLDENNVTFE